jgi:hypothetical protein
MDVAAWHRWHWLVISLIIGPLFGYSRQQSLQDLPYNFGNTITGTRNFEDYVLTKVGSHHMFEDLKVFKQVMPDDQGVVRDVYVVTGRAFLGDYERDGDKLVARWRPMFFATAPPYRPRMSIDQFNTAEADLAEQFRALKEPTVMDFLSMVSAARGIKYRHAWWYELGIGSWTAISFVVIGIIWPTVLNFVLFRSWRRPSRAPRENAVVVAPSNLSQAAD